MSVTVRVATEDDIQEMAEVHYRSFDHSVRDILPESVRALRTLEDRVRAWKETFAGLEPSDPQPGVAVTDNGRIVGVTWPGLDPDDPTLGFAHYHYVDPNELRQGIGQRLLDFCDDQFRAAGCTRAILMVFEKNVDAQRFYEQGGWTFAGERRDEPIDGTDLTLVARIMTKPITA